MKEVKFMVGIVVSLLIGGGLGFTTFSLCTAAKWADQYPSVTQSSK